jgi:hypothetical protein
MEHNPLVMNPKLRPWQLPPRLPPLLHHRLLLPRLLLCYRCSCSCSHGCRHLPLLLLRSLSLPCQLLSGGANKATGSFNFSRPWSF